MKKGKKLNKNIGSKSLHHFVQSLLVPPSDSKSQSHRFWIWGPCRTVQSRMRDSTGQNAQNMWRSRKLASVQRNGRSPRSFHFPRKMILNTVQITCKQHPFSDHTEMDPSEDKEGCKRPNHESQNTDAQGTLAPATTLYVLCGLQEGNPLTYTENFTEIVSGEPLRQGGG